MNYYIYVDDIREDDRGKRRKEDERKESEEI